MTPLSHDDLSQPDLDQPRPRSGGLLQIAWQRKSLIALGAVAGLILGSLYYAQREPVYQTNAQVLVIKKRPDALPASGNNAQMSYFEDYVSTHVTLMRSPLIVERAVEKHGLKNLRSLAGEREPVQAILRALSVGRDRDSTTAGGSNVLNLSFRATASDECAKVLNAIIESYKSFLDEKYHLASDDTLKLITQARDVLEKELAEKEAAYLELRKQGPLLARTKEGVSAHQSRLADIEAKRAALHLRRAEIEARQVTVDQVQKNGNRAALAALVTEWSNRNGLDRTPADAGRRKTATDIEEQLIQLQLQELALEQDYGPAYPQLKAVRNRIAFLRDLIARQKSGKALFSEEDDPRLLASVEVYRESLKQELEDLAQGDKALAALLESQRQEARRLTNFELEEAKLASEIARNKEKFDAVISRLKEVGFTKDFGGFEASILAPAGLGLKVEPRLFTTLSVSLLLGFLGGLGLAYLAELSDKSFRTADEVRRRLGLPVIGHVPQFVPEAEPAEEMQGIDPSLCTVYHSLSPEAEAYRSVRTALYFSARGKGHKVFQVTSPDPGDGKSTLTANLAVSMAQSGKRVLLIDADFRRPRQHQLFGLDAHSGLSAVLAGEAALADAIQESAVQGLSVLPCGPIPPNPAELLTSLQFQEFSEGIREQFDFILIDTPPLLAVTDPAVVAPRVDGVVLTFRLSKNGRPRAERAREILQTLGANVLGVVLNGVPQGESSSYGYGGYEYSSSANPRTGATVAANGHAPAPSRNGTDRHALVSAGPAHHRPRFWHRLFSL